MLVKIPTLISEIKQGVNLLTAAEAKIKCQAMSGVVIDVREPSEVSEKVAPATVNIPRGVLEMKVSTLYPNDEQPIFIHCASGVRAIFAAEQLKRIGYKNIWAITCPIDEVCSAL